MSLSKALDEDKPRLFYVSRCLCRNLLTLCRAVSPATRLPWLLLCGLDAGGSPNVLASPSLQNGKPEAGSHPQQNTGIFPEALGW